MAGVQRQRVLIWGLLSFLAIVVGVGLGVAVFYFTVPRPKIGIIKVENAILFQDTFKAIADMMDFAADRDSIKAVVISLDSPGGGVVESEELFLKMVQLRQKKPVVVSIGPLAASGGYMVALGASRIYAKESSFIGNIGVIARVGKPELPPEDLLMSGPFKATGFPNRAFVEAVELLKEEFVEKVVAQRGAKLKVSREELSDGRIYLGAQGLANGLIDDIGTLNDAIAQAAELAGIERYKLVDVNKETGQETLASFFFFKFNRSQSPYTQLFYLYIEPTK